MLTVVANLVVFTVVAVLLGCLVCLLYRWDTKIGCSMFKGFRHI